MENPIKMDDLGGKPPIFGKNPYITVVLGVLGRAPTSNWIPGIHLCLGF